MKDKPFMPKATAVWLVENTKISFKQIATFCHLHELEVKGIADGDVAKGIKAYNPILAGQLTREDIEMCSKDSNRELILNKKTMDNSVLYKPLSDIAAIITPQLKKPQVILDKIDEAAEKAKEKMNQQINPE